MRFISIKNKEKEVVKLLVRCHFKDLCAQNVVSFVSFATFFFYFNESIHSETAFRHDAIKDGDPVKGRVLFRT